MEKRARRLRKQHNGFSPHESGEFPGGPIEYANIKAPIDGPVIARCPTSRLESIDEIIAIASRTKRKEDALFTNTQGNKCLQLLSKDVGFQLERVLRERFGRRTRGDRGVGQEALEVGHTWAGFQFAEAETPVRERMGVDGEQLVPVVVAAEYAPRLFGRAANLAGDLNPTEFDGLPGENRLFVVEEPGNGMVVRKAEVLSDVDTVSTPVVLVVVVLVIVVGDGEGADVDVVQLGTGVVVVDGHDC